MGLEEDRRSRRPRFGARARLLASVRPLLACARPLLASVSPGMGRRRGSVWRLPMPARAGGPWMLREGGVSGHQDQTFSRGSAL